MLRDSIPSDTATPDLYDILRYHLGWLDEDLRPLQSRGGKLLRPTLCLLACEATGADYRRGLPAAAALELLHNFSLIHDDVEDRGPERRGRPSVWARWGDALAVNAGDSLLILSELTLLRASAFGVDPAVVLSLVRHLNQCCLTLTEGQHLDLTLEGDPDVTVEQYFSIIARKTAALLGCSAQIGSLSGGARPDQAEHFREFGYQLGLAFQIQDDLLGIWGDPGTTGKVATDVYGRKVTLPVILAIQQAAPSLARRLAEIYRSAAPGSSDVAEVTAALDQLGVRQSAEAEATAAVDRAMAALDRAAPVEPSDQELRAVALSLMGRAS